MEDIALGEFLGCIFLMVFGGGVVANCVLEKSKGLNAGWLAIAIGWGFAVMGAVFVAKSTGSIQADLNPAVTLAKYLLGGIYEFSQIIPIILAQFFGCFVGAIIVWLAYFSHWKETKDPATILAVFSTGPAIRNSATNFLNEVIGTCVLVFGIGAIFGKATNNGEISPAMGPYFVGLLVWAVVLSLGGVTGCAINPARDLAPRLAHALLPIAGKGKSDWSYAWIPVFGPVVGGIVGALLWRAFL
ncbi:MIP/aquaporin family protein [Fluviispira multicolorata]|uniref:Aquaporin family protein n=1 Tax=Fluviispira multicolorata TaxID=2654512 RepID=A0A833JEZ2_9BACT|nr:MIP/aquaporin family protein [Fluviispira multicolorata]KAB8033464.1 aquaporin family protein [Fluviispira multicolorata]